MAGGAFQGAVAKKRDMMYNKRNPFDFIHVLRKYYHSLAVMV